MRHEGDTIYVEDSDTATVREIAAEFGLALPVARRLLELDETPSDDPLRPMVAALFRVVLESKRCDGWVGGNPDDRCDRCGEYLNCHAVKP